MSPKVELRSAAGSAAGSRTACRRRQVSCFQGRRSGHWFAQQTGMFLFISPSLRARETGPALEKAFHQRVEFASNLLKGTVALRAGEFAAVVLDQAVLEAEPDRVDALLNLVGDAAPVFVNLGIIGLDRVVRDVRSALNRYQRERALAARAAQAALRSELNGAVSGILLCSEQALSVPSLPRAAESKLRSVRELALQLRSRMGAAG